MSAGAPVELRRLVPGDAPGCVEVVRSLPEWFGYPTALEGIATSAAQEAGHVALEDRRVIAFVTTRPSFEESLEIRYLAVHASRRRSGLGTRLVAAVASDALAQGVPSVCLLTLGPAGGSPHYEETVGFYRSLGFWRTKELRIEEWGGAPALVMVAPSAALGAVASRGA